MNKKSSTSPIEVGTPKGATRNVRTLSQNSSAGSSKGKLTAGKPINVGKQNLSENVQPLENKVRSNEAINPLKGLKRIKERALGETKPLLEKQSVKVIDRQKVPPRQLQKASIPSQSSSKSLLSNKVKPSLLNQSEKKSTPLNSQKSTPKSIPKKTSTSKREGRTLRGNQSLQTINNENHRNQEVQTQLDSPLQTPKMDKEQVNKEAISKNLKIEEVTDQVIQKPIEKKSSKQLMISMFKIRSKLAEGTFSTTFEVIHIQTGFLYCLKVFEKIKIKQQGLEEQIISEIKFRRNLKFHNMQRLFTVFDDEVYIYFVQEYVTGFGLLAKELLLKRKLTEKESGLIFKEVFEIVRAIHSQNYIHRDIRIQNLAKCFGMIKLIDFSWIACLRFKKERDTFCGTYKYAPPELLEGQNYDESIDIWSLGILLYELCTGQSPFNDGFAKRNSHSMTFPIFLSNELVDLIGRLLSDKGIRMRIQEILMHEWTNKWELDGFVCKEIWDFWVL